MATGKPAQVAPRPRHAVRAVRVLARRPVGPLRRPEKTDKRVRLWNLAGYEEVRVLHSTVSRRVTRTPCSRPVSRPTAGEIVTASRDRTARLWDAATGQRLEQFQEGHEFLATNAVFFPDGKRLATGAGDNSVRLWDLAGGTPARRALTDRPHRHPGRLARRQLDRHRQPGQRSPALGHPIGQSRSADHSRATRREVSAVAFSPDGTAAGHRRRHRAICGSGKSRARPATGRSPTNFAATAARSPRLRIHARRPAARLRQRRPHLRPVGRRHRPGSCAAGLEASRLGLCVRPLGRRRARAHGLRRRRRAALAAWPTPD